MDGALSLSFCKGTTLKFHHTPFSQLHLSSGFTTWWPPPLLQTPTSCFLCGESWSAFQSRQSAKVRRTILRHSDMCFSNLQWGVRKASAALCNFSNLYFVTACISEGLVLTTITRSPQAKRATQNRFESILTLFASFLQNSVWLLRLKLRWFCKLHKQSTRCW